MTYADKYALMKAYKISTGDDPDQTASEDNHYSKATAPKPKKQPTPREKLIAKLKEKGVNIDEYAKEKGLTSKTTAEEFTKLLNELEGE